MFALLSRIRARRKLAWLQEQQKIAWDAYHARCTAYDMAKAAADAAKAKGDRRGFGEACRVTKERMHAKLQAEMKLRKAVRGVVA